MHPAANNSTVVAAGHRKSRVFLAMGRETVSSGNGQSINDIRMGIWEREWVRLPLRVHFGETARSFTD
jgi:hypothetical protein